VGQFFKVDVQYANHPKVLAVGEKLAMRNLAAIAWSYTMGTDGHIPPYALPALRMSPKDASCLVDKGLWEVNGNGWAIHDYADWQETVEDRSAMRAAWRERKRKERDKA
jgi:hypothetical protein